MGSVLADGVVFATIIVHKSVSAGRDRRRYNAPSAAPRGDPGMTFLWLAYLHLCLFLVGCCVGSFLNVCIYRMGTGRSISWPGSHCGSCFTAIPMRHNIPLVSYLLLRGRCAVCGA